MLAPVSRSGLSVSPKQTGVLSIWEKSVPRCRLGAYALTSFGGRLLVTAAISISVTAHAAHAEVDLTGDWHVELTNPAFGLTFDEVWSITQTGNTVVVSPPGGFTGTINSDSGAFSLTKPFFCPVLGGSIPETLDGTLTPDGEAFTGMILSYGTTPHGCVGFLTGVLASRDPCGNGVVDPGEECDGGNEVNGDGCDANCTVTRCGNGIVAAGEQCDDGNSVDGDGCESDCTLPPTPTETPTPTPTRTPTVAPTDLPSSTPTDAATPTLTPRIVSLSVSSATGGPGDAVNITVSVATSSQIVGATENDITFDSQALSLDPATCRLATATNNRLGASLPQAGTARVFVQVGADNVPILDGPLYTCTFRVSAGAVPASYALANGNAMAFRDAGTRLPVVGTDGAIIVSLSTRTCTGDCNADRQVTVDELITGVNIALGNAPATTCLQFDTNADGMVTITELIAAVTRGLEGC